MLLQAVVVTAVEAEGEEEEAVVMKVAVVAEDRVVRAQEASGEAVR